MKCKQTMNQQNTNQCGCGTEARLEGITRSVTARYVTAVKLLFGPSLNQLINYCNFICYQTPEWINKTAMYIQMSYSGTVMPF